MAAGAADAADHANRSAVCPVGATSVECSAYACERESVGICVTVINRAAWHLDCEGTLKVHGRRSSSSQGIDAAVETASSSATLRDRDGASSDCQRRLARIEPS